MAARKTASPEERFWAKVKKGDLCWTWQGSLGDGYGTLSVRGRSVRAHRFAYELLVGPIPDGLQIDHLCRNRACVNPDHLEPVTQAENLMRGDTIPARHAAKTHCIHGHEFTPENTDNRADGSRSCRTCRHYRDSLRDYTGRVRSY